MSDTARDKAIEAMQEPYCTIQLDAENNWHAIPESCGEMLDAVPDQVLADLLIERGALTRAGFAGWRLYDGSKVLSGDRHWHLGEQIPVYRLTLKDPG